MKRKDLLLLDQTVGRVLFGIAALSARLRPARIELPPRLGEPPRFLVIRPGGLGDAIMCIPFLRCLRETFPDAHVTVVCVAKNRAMLEMTSYHDELLVLGDSGSTIRNLRRLRRMDIDVLFDLEPHRRTSSLVSWWTSARARVGFDTNSRRRLYTHLVAYAEDRWSESENMLRQLTVVGVPWTPGVLRPARIEIDTDRRDAARSRLLDAGLDPDSDFIVAIAVGALKPENLWIMSRFVELIESILAEDSRARVLLLGSAGDVENTNVVLGGLRNAQGVTNLVAQTPLADTLAILSLCRVLLACDGGIVHMAAAAGCGTVSLWGPSDMHRFKPPGEEHVGVRSDYACVPCMTRERLGEFPGCPYARRCLNDLGVASVMSAYLVQKRQIETLRTKMDQ